MTAAPLRLPLPAARPERPASRSPAGAGPRLEVRRRCGPGSRRRVRRDRRRDRRPTWAASGRPLAPLRPRSPAACSERLPSRPPADAGRVQKAAGAVAAQVAGGASGKTVVEIARRTRARARKFGRCRCGCGRRRRVRRDWNRDRRPTWAAFGIPAALLRPRCRRRDWRDWRRVHPTTWPRPEGRRRRCGFRRRGRVRRTAIETGPRRRLPLRLHQV
jgi:hypothetical protein